MLFLPAAIMPRSLTRSDSLQYKSKERLVADFVDGLRNASTFKEVEHLFLSLNDFNDLIATLRNSTMPESYKRQLEDKDNLQKQRDEMELNIKRHIIAPWEQVIARISDKNVSLKYHDFKVKKMVKRGITTLDVTLNFTVTKNSKDYEVQKTILIMDIGGRLKIVNMFNSI